MEDVDIGVFTILTHRTNTSSGRAHPRPLCTVQGVTRVSELRIQCIVVGHRAKYTVSTHGDNGSDCNTSLMMSYPWHHLLALGTSHSLNESPNSRAEQCVGCLCHCNNSRLGWAQSLNRVDWYLQPLYLYVACFCQSEQSVVAAWLCSWADNECSDVCHICRLYPALHLNPGLAASE